MLKRFPHPLRVAGWTLATGLALLALLFAFQAWIVYGPDMFLAMAQTGLSWCL